jgi:ferredoxin-type protein NapH
MTLIKKNTRNNTYILPGMVFMVTAAILSVVQLKLYDHPLLLAERFIPGGGWVELLIVAIYGAFVAFKMEDVTKVAQWRRITWTVFSVLFFLQLMIGLSGAKKFLMTGKLHLPVPMMILGGPLYRGQLSVMTALFLSTIVLTGPAWCSQLCYFGAFDSVASRGKIIKSSLRHKTAIKASILLLVVTVALILRWFNVDIVISTIIAVTFGAAGIAVMILFSGRSGKMIHCILYCPIGTLVNMLKNVNPFRIAITSSCNQCMRCIQHCKYDALQAEDIRHKKPAYSCTLCGDCLAACHEGSLQYRFFRLKANTARKLYLLLTISLHAIFLALARI